MDLTDLIPFLFFFLMGAVGLGFLLFQINKLATRAELKHEVQRLDQDIASNRKETANEVKQVHDRVDDLLIPLGEIRGELKGNSEQLRQINTKLNQPKNPT